MLWGLLCAPKHPQPFPAQEGLSLTVGGWQKAQTAGKGGEQTANATLSSLCLQTALQENPARPHVQSITPDHSKWDLRQEQHKFPDPLAHP